MKPLLERWRGRPKRSATVFLFNSLLCEGFQRSAVGSFTTAKRMRAGKPYRMSIRYVQVPQRLSDLEKLVNSTPWWKDVIVIVHRLMVFTDLLEHFPNGRSELMEQQDELRQVVGVLKSCPPFVRFYVPVDDPEERAQIVEIIGSIIGQDRVFRPGEFEVDLKQVAASSGKWFRFEPGSVFVRFWNFMSLGSFNSKVRI